MSFESAVTFFIAIFIFGITPGPGVFAILAKAMISGPKSSIMLILGMICSDVLYLILACLGLATVANNWSEVFIAIRYVGAGYLIYLGYMMLNTLPQPKDNIKVEGVVTKQSALLSGFIQGFLISISNPKVILFYISFLPTFINLNVLTSTDILLVSVLSALALFAGLMLIAIGASRMANLLKTPVAHQRLNRVAGSIMILAGLYLVLR
ncbi:LysE family translocator [Psychromonas arctica]|uniref:LysE family translocator n=1 Tax=Psychromonas arctica TaxID=168275 RepID=UPI002FCEBEA8